MSQDLSNKNRQTAPYGSWESPITADLIAAATIKLGEIYLDQNTIYWLESRPHEGGRTTIMRLDEATGRPEECLPEPYNVRSKVHEYGGGAMAVWQGKAWFVNAKDQAIYQFSPGHDEPKQLHYMPGTRYGNLIVDPFRNRLIMVQEMQAEVAKSATNALVAINIRNGQRTRLTEGYDFYAAHQLSPDGRQLAWLAWQHPNMPWDGCELWVANIDDETGKLKQENLIAGGKTEAIFQPQWGPDSALYFVSDINGWWNLYQHTPSENRVLLEAEIELGLPQWTFNMSTYGIVSEKEMLVAGTRDGEWQLFHLNLKSGKVTAIDLPYNYIDQVRVRREKAWFLAANSIHGKQLVEMTLPDYQHQVIRTTQTFDLSPEIISEAEPMLFSTSHNDIAHAFFYRPVNAQYTAPAAERPPLIVMGHSGPTGAASSYLNLKIQYWTSRGFAVLDVNYRGSTGYGRTYREKLNGQWGIVDVDDCIYGTRELVKQGSVDQDRLIIRGSSAGGFTVLSALAFHETFKAGAVYYGISDLESARAESHKFESYYFDRMIGPYPAQKADYQARSPLLATEKFTTPTIFFQGMKDKVVLPEQSEKMAQMLISKKVPVAYVTFEEEGHGFRVAKNIRQSLEDELYFYQRIFNIQTMSKNGHLKIMYLPV